MARASDHKNEWKRMLTLLAMDKLDEVEEEELNNLFELFRGESQRGEINRDNKSKPLILIDLSGNRTVYPSRKELIYQTGITASSLYDALLRNNGVMKSRKLKGYRVKELT